MELSLDVMLKMVNLLTLVLWNFKIKETLKVTIRNTDVSTN